jgi:hypothetical protein
MIFCRPRTPIDVDITISVKGFVGKMTRRDAARVIETVRSMVLDPDYCEKMIETLMEAAIPK